MSCKSPHIALTAVCLLALSLIFIGAGQLFQSTPRAAVPSESAFQSEDPIAVVKSILVNGTEKLVADQSEMKVTLVTAEEQAGEAGMLLTAGDEVSTGTNAQVTILFLDAAPEKDNEVLVDSNAQVRVGSIFDREGRVLVRVKSKFDTSTEKLKLDVTGTEYELDVRNGTNTVQVLEGAVAVQKGSFSPSSIAENAGRVAESVATDGGVNFAHSSIETPGRTQAKMEFVAVQGKATSYTRDFVFSNSCHQKHLFRIRGPRNMRWFQLLGADEFEIEAGRSSSISFAIRANPLRVPVGVYEGEIIAHCLDCAQEPECQIAGLLLPISITVIAGPGTRDPDGGTGEQVGQSSAAARKLEQVVLTADGTLIRRRASIDDVDRILKWSNNVILAGQPTYSAPSIVPNFQSWQERNEQFRVARRGAILSSDPRSYEILGALYVDWGNGAKAVDDLQRIGAASPQTPQRLTVLGEAYRLMGRIGDAQKTLEQTVNQYPEFSPGVNALGNVYLERAKILQDRKDYEGAKKELERAKDWYARAFEARSQTQPQTDLARSKPIPTLKANKQTTTEEYSSSTGQKAVPQQPTASANDLARVVSQSNIGDANLVLGDIAREQGRTNDALQHYQVAEQTFSKAEGMSSSYAFATKGLGDVYRAITSVSIMQGDKARANDAFTRSRQKYAQAIGLHRDMSQAYVGLGNLYEDIGRKDEAINAYRQAIRVRPELPQAYYHYAVAIADRDPRRAAAYARAYLKLEREVFKQGEKANEARRVIEHRAPTTPTPTPAIRPTPYPTTPTPTPTPTAEPSPSSSGSLVKVPSVKGDEREVALRKLRERGLEGQITEQADCDASGKVLSTIPKRDDKVASGSTVTVFVSSAGENAVTVPSLINRSLSEAEAELRNIGLGAKIRRRQESDAVEENTVLGQKPEANTKLKSGCTVDLTVSIRVHLVEVPNYLGLSRQEAFQQLPRFFGNLTRGRVAEADSDAPAGTVIAQNPKPGAMVRQGTSVDLVFSRSESTGPSGVLVPELRGMTEDQARISLQKARLRPGNVSYRTVKARVVNRVIQQDPQPNQTVPIGTAVNLVISRAPDIILR